MRRRTKSPKGPRGGASRGTGRGRGRGSRGGSRGGGSGESARGGRSAGRGERGGHTQVFAPPVPDLPPIRPSATPSTSYLRTKAASEGDSSSSSSKRNNDFYLHKKFKKPTNTVLDENKPSTSGSSATSLSPPNGLKPGLETSLSNGHSQNSVIIGDKNKNDSSAIDTSVIRENQSLESGKKSATQNGSQIGTVAGNASSNGSSSSSTMVYKPKFRMASESENEVQSTGQGASNSNSPPLISNHGDPINLSTDAGKVSKNLRFDRQSLDDRISKIIDENQSLLEWPEHFTKKLKSHTRHSHSHGPQPRPNALTMLSGGSSMDLSSGSKGPINLSSSSSSSNSPHNGLLRHSSFDMTSSGGTMELLTNPLILKAQADLLKTSFAHSIPPSSPSIADLSFPFAVAANASPLVPKKRRRMSPTPNRLCGGEVSELPVNESSLSKSYYQDVDMNVRVNNTSGAKVTIRTSGMGNGGIQSAIHLSRYIDSVPSSLGLDGTSLLFPGSSDSLLLLPKEEAMESEGSNSRSPPGKFANNKRKMSRASQQGFNNESILPPPKLPSSLIPEFPKHSAKEGIPTLSPKLSPTISPKLPSPSPAKAATIPSPKANASLELPHKSTTESPPPASSASFQVLPNAPGSNPKRPNFLALKPVNNISKKNEVGVLPSPETPRVAKSYNQMSINGNAYTYLGFKVSTRSSYTCLFKPQPMFVPQNIDPKLSMYSNWQPCPKDPKEPELSMSTNDSRVNGRKDFKTLYTSAIGKNCDTLTVSSPDKQPPISSPMSEKSPLAMFSGNLAGLSRSSEAVPPQSIGLGKSSFPTSFSTSTITSAKPAGSGTSVCTSTAVTSSSARAISTFSSSSDTSSADESSREYKKGKRKAYLEKDGSSKDDSSSNSESMKSEALRPDGSRVKIMEGGFESNEAYTYVRGRGRGRYVCEACGIRCKKPSMLRKHLKTHTDLRPYTCKLCNFSFKTKGNLTKHQKSKSHHKKCMSMGIHPESSQSLASTGPSMDSNSENDSDDDDDDMDSDSQGEEADGSPSPGNDSESVEKEIALSLLDLSRMSRRPSECDNETRRIEKPAVSNSDRNPMQQIPSSESAENLGPEAPMDLTVRSKPTPVSHFSNIKRNNEEPESKRIKLDVNGLALAKSSIVAEAQRWDPQEQGFNLKKILNTGANGRVLAHSSQTQQTAEVLISLNREIKQEVLDYPEEAYDSNVVRKCNGFGSDISRKRQDSEASVSSFGSVGGNAVSNDAQQPGTSRGRSVTPPPPRLHQPWLSPAEKKSLEAENKRETVEEKGSKVLNDQIEKLELQSIEGPVQVNGKVFPPAHIVGKPQAEFRQPSGAQALVKEDGKSECNVCGKMFARPSQLTLHMNIHYLERPFRCDPCGVSFRTKGHLIKHRRSSSHDCKVYLTEAWGVANEENPRPFKCPDCKIAFRIHGHLAKHLRSKMHIMRMECLGKLPFGIYFEMEKSGMNLNEIDTTDCDMSLVSLQTVAKKIYGDTWMERLTVPIEEPA